MSTDADKKKICFLVVDDFESMRKLVIKNLNAMGYTNIYQAANGQEALKQLASISSIKVVITDWNMPVMPGIELLRAIRAHDQYKTLPVLMITAEIARHQVQEAAEAGVSDFLVKPFTVGNLQSKLDKMLANLEKGIVNGLKVQQMDDAINDDRSGLGALMGKQKPPTSAPIAKTNSMPSAAANFQASPASSPAVSYQPRYGSEPSALIITEDLQARMAKQASILVVDDIADNIDVLVGLLQDEYKVRAAKSGEAALKLLVSGKDLPDLILLDVMMPEMDGFEVCRRLKAYPKTAGIPVIFLTAVDDATDVVKGFELGAVDYVTKPANPTVLKVRVRNHLTRSRAFVELQQQNEVMAENLHLREEVDRMTAHDLKNPIGGIINFTDMLLNDEMMTQDQKELLEAVGESAHTLLNMVTLSLDLFKIEQGVYELQPSRIDLIQIIRKLLTEKSAEIGAKSLHVTNTLAHTVVKEGEEPEFTVQGDGLLCYSMLGNLIKNAVEAAPTGGKLAITYSHSDEGRGAIKITNSGAAPDHVRASFFDKYVTAGKKGGTGLGTYSAKLLAEVQDGTIAMSVD
ncbi:MAG: response regulator, partial [Gallionellaceae bacterium]|nr:response regulator [Gallionellaceae bacterium]